MASFPSYSILIFLPVWLFGAPATVESPNTFKLTTFFLFSLPFLIISDCCLTVASFSSYSIPVFTFFLPFLLFSNLSPMRIPPKPSDPQGGGACRPSSRALPVLFLPTASAKWPLVWLIVTSAFLCCNLPPFSSFSLYFLFFERYQVYRMLVQLLLLFLLAMCHGKKLPDIYWNSTNPLWVLHLFSGS